MNRFAPMQLCPALIKRLVTQSRAAPAISASSQIIYGSLPPSSRTDFFSAEPAIAATDFPAGMLPVNVTAFTFGFSMTVFTSLPLISNVRNTFSGKPASVTSFSIASAQPATLLACFSKPVFPAISAGARNRKTCQNGKFQGITASTVPSG